MTIDFGSQYMRKIKLDGAEYNIFDIKKAASDYGFALEQLPYSLRVLVENVVRNGYTDSLSVFKEWLKDKKSDGEINYMPSRVLMQDFTGVPAIVDLASMRDAMKTLGGDPLIINPLIPVDLVIDHSLQVDSYGKNSSFAENVEKEVLRNKERYEFLKWGQESFKNFRVVPPGTGICHQVNLEYLAQCVFIEDSINGKYAYPDSLVGTDSHTTMVNSLGVLGWGVGGIEAEVAMLKQPLPMILPEVVGVKLVGKLKENITATDLVLTITQILRQKGVVGKFVEFFGGGLDNLSLADRATIANMAPEYGATCGFFPIDDETLKYLKLTGRNAHNIEVVKEYSKLQNLWRNDIWENGQETIYTDVIELDMGSIDISLAGPCVPQDRVKLADMKNNFKLALEKLAENGVSVDEKYAIMGTDDKFGHGDIAIASITSCTNTSNPAVMIAAGIVAKKARGLGLKTKAWVKTSLAPGSKVVTEYLNKTGLSKYLDELGFNLVGYGCTTCIGNSGPLNSAIESVIKNNGLVAASVLSGNRNFEGRIHPYVKANYLASPPLVVAYAIAGTVNINLETEVLAQNESGQDIYLKDILPTAYEVEYYLNSCVTTEIFQEKYQDVFVGDKNWQNIIATKSETYNWKESTYIKSPPYFDNIAKQEESSKNILQARILGLFGNSMTTDHISPAGAISINSPAGKFLTEKGIKPADFNSYGARRGNHEVMMRGTFANARIKNFICNGVEGGITMNYLQGKQMSIYDAAMDYKKHKVPLVIFAGREYGTGSSRDWAAKGTHLLGIKAVIAESFERIHRSNLVGMGVLPLAFNEGDSWKSLNIKGNEEISILGLSDDTKPCETLKCIIKNSVEERTIIVKLQVYTEQEMQYIKYNGILGAVLDSVNISNVTK